MKTILKFPILVLFVLIVSMILLPIGCGKSNSVPDGSTITITPPSTVINASPMVAEQATTVGYSVVVRYADGTPIPKAIIKISGGYAEPRNATNTSPRYQFYPYPGGNLNPNNYPVDSGFSAQTDDYGTYNFSITIYGTVGGVLNSFDDRIDVFSGTAYGKADLFVN